MWVDHGFFWIIFGVIAVAAIFFRYLEQASHHRTLRTLAEKGQPIPPEILQSGGRGYRGTGTLRAGLIMMAIGAGIGIMFWGMTGYGDFFTSLAEHGSWLPTIGVIPFLIGVALFLSAFFERRRPQRDEPRHDE